MSVVGARSAACAERHLDRVAGGVCALVRVRAPRVALGMWYAHTLIVRLWYAF